MTHSYIYQYKFISPVPLYALIKEELKSYFEAGSVDDTLFSLWTEKVLDKLGKGTIPINTTFLDIKEGEAPLPEGFEAVREVWVLKEHQQMFTDPSSTYSYVLDTSIRIDTPGVDCDICDTCKNPPLIQAIYKHTNRVFRQFFCEHKLSRATILPKRDCKESGWNHQVYDIHGNKLVTHLGSAPLTLLYYGEKRDEQGYKYIPDDTRIKEAIEYFIKYKLYEMLFNQSTDESFQQCKYKMEAAHLASDEKYTIAETWMKKETTEQKQIAIHRTKSRFNKYKLR